jgi:uncharacterized repeat protein (TIGR03803 family)
MSLTMTEVTSKCLRGGYRVSEICNRRACSTREHTFGNRDRSSTSNSRLSALFMLQNQLLRSAIVRLAVFGLTILMATSAEAASKYKVLHAFTGTPDGGGVLAGVAVDGNSSLYGTTWAGGAYGEGTVFELIPSSGGKWAETGSLKSLSAILLGRKALRLVGPMKPRRLACALSILALALTITPVASAGPRHKVMHAFGFGKDAGGLVSNLTFDRNGNLYGTTSGGGTYNEGTVSELSPSQGGTGKRSCCTVSTISTMGTFPMAASSSMRQATSTGL